MLRSFQILKGGPQVLQRRVDEEPAMGIYGGFFFGVACMLFVVACITLAIAMAKSLIQWWRGGNVYELEVDMEAGHGHGLYPDLYSDNPHTEYYNINHRPTDDPYQAGITSLISFDSTNARLSSHIPNMQHLLATFRHAVYASQSDPDNVQSYQRMEALRRQITQIVIHNTRYYPIDLQPPAGPADAPPAYMAVVPRENDTQPPPFPS